MLPRVLVSTGKTGFRVCGEGNHRAKTSALASLSPALFACIDLRAQTFCAVTGHEAVTSLDDLWCFHAGENPAWAEQMPRRSKLNAEESGGIIAHLPDEKQYIALDAGDGLCAWSIGQ